VIPAAPALTVVAKIAPRLINAPASTASTNKLTPSSAAFFTPICSAFAAISAGSSASMRISLLGVIAHTPKRKADFSDTYLIGLCNLWAVANVRARADGCHKR
jgi:hypothetical protein